MKSMHAAQLAAQTTYPLVKATSVLRTHRFSFRKDGWPAAVPDMYRAIDVHYHDDYLMVIHKPANLIIDADHWSVQEYLQRTYPQYPHFHLVHQIDYATSGIMVLGLDKKATGRVGKLFQDRMVRKEYVAVVRGWIEQDTLIGEDATNPLRMAVVTDETKGRRADTIVHVRRRGYLSAPNDSGLVNVLPADGDAADSLPDTDRRIPVTLVHLDLKTGRRHQLRVHLASLGHPIVGDPLYESDPPAGTIPPASWPWRAHGADDVVQRRMLLHSHYILLPLHRGRTRNAPRLYTHDLAVHVPAPFVGWVKCRCGRDADAECEACEVTGVKDRLMRQWEEEQMAAAQTDFDADVAEQKHKEAAREARLAKRAARRAAEAAAAAADAEAGEKEPAVAAADGGKRAEKAEAVESAPGAVGE
ncbi:hypothetical protein H9P43_000266 [Blastocladiella emersonii ATCC 22665]|nr:hypothetical protein H9P43_000266 [Blastocladiella emersonii ATCC 22665]